MRIVGFLALHREKIGTKLYGYVLAKRYTRWRFMGHPNRDGNTRKHPRKHSNRGDWVYTVSVWKLKMGISVQVGEPTGNFRSANGRKGEYYEDVEM